MLMKVLVLVTLVLAGMSSVYAHPAVGIVMDSQGNIYYSDLKHVWKLSPGGKKSIAVRKVHTHELYIDTNDNLYGEHLWYEGEATDRWGHRVWRLGSDGILDDIITARQGFRDDYDDFHFVRDKQGNMYWVDRGEPTVIRKRSTNGKVTSVASANLRDVRWMTVTSNGIVFLIDRHDLIRITPDGVVRTVVRSLPNRGWSRLFGVAIPFMSDRHAVQGLWTDPKGNLYAAITSDRMVKKVSPDGKVQVVTRSQVFWSPTGGLIAPNGDLWILEYNEHYWSGIKARVRRIQKDGRSTVFK